MRKKLIGTLAALMIMAAAGPASAEYICRWNWVPSSGGLGSSGYIQMTDYTGPSCTGTFLKTWVMCSSGASATSGSCPSSTSYHFTITQMSAMAAAISHAALWNTRVTWAATTCNGGASGCLAYPVFHSGS